MGTENDADQGRSNYGLLRLIIVSQNHRRRPFSVTEHGQANGLACIDGWYKERLDPIGARWRVLDPGSDSFKPLG